jgi:transcriptional regulator with XRE-family HTH domain
VPRLREVRLRRFLTLTPLAERAGAAVSTSSALEPGSHTAAPATAREAAEVVGVGPRGLAEAPTA